MFNNKNIISSYKRKDAIEDEVQFNIDSIDLSLRKDAGIIYPVFITDSVMNIINESAATGICDIKGILWDICYMFALSARKVSESRLNFIVCINMKTSTGKIEAVEQRFLAEIGAMDCNDPNPAITIMTEQDQ
jgi:hypothetical protein